jgi:tripartite-type tricarboxylate transporter receptor subunit TctC
MRMMRAICAVAALVAAVAAMAMPPAAAADAWPAKPIRLVVPFSAGGTTDIIARIVAARMSRELGRQVVVENMEGAGGTVGTEMVARARPDGYTLILHSASSGAINPALYRNLKYDVRRDFAPVALMTRTANVLVVRKGFPARNLRELVALVRANPGRFNYGSSGNGTILHLSGALFLKQARLDIVHIPYRGAGPAMNDVIAGTVDMMWDNMPSAIGQIRAGNVRAIAVTTRTRSPVLPNVPAFAELGYPTYETDTWSAIFAPAKTPPAIIARLNQAIFAALRDPATARRLTAIGCQVMAPSSPAVLAKFLDQQIKYWAPVVAASGARIE